MARKSSTCRLSLFPLPFCSILLLAFLLFFFTPSSSQAGERAFKITAAAVKDYYLAHGAQKFAGLVRATRSGRWAMSNTSIPSLVLFIPNLFFKK